MSHNTVESISKIKLRMIQEGLRYKQLEEKI